MGWWDRFRGHKDPVLTPLVHSGVAVIDTPEKLEEYLRAGGLTAAGQAVTPETAMRVAAVYACVRIIIGPPATLPLDIKRRVNATTREDASDTELWEIFRRRPNRWQKPHQFKRMMQLNVLLRGNAYAYRSVSFGKLQELIPLDPDRMTVTQNDDLTLVYEYRRRDGNLSRFKSSEIWHLFGMTLNGYTGVTPLTFARETIGLSLAMGEHGSAMFKNGARVSGMLTTDKKLGKEGLDFLKTSLDEFRAGSERDGKTMILEEGMKWERVAMTAEDAQWIESRKFSRSDIAMFFGVPPHMIGDTEKSTSWGSGIEQQSIGFVAYTLEDHLTMWEEGITSDLNTDPEIYARFNRAALVKGDIKARSEAYVKALQWGWLNPDEVRALEDLNPRADGEGGKYYDPPNTAGGDDTKKGAGDEPQEAT